MRDRTAQSQLIADGLMEFDYSDLFETYLLERPETPQLTIASQALAFAIETNPVQNHGRVGVCVPQQSLGQLHKPLGMAIKLKNNTVAMFFLYADMSCILALPNSDSGTIRATTLPFQLSNAEVKKKDGRRITSMKLTKGEKSFMLQRSTDSVPLPLDKTIPEHADFMVDLALEIQAVFERTDTDGPIYQVQATAIPESLAQDGKMPMSVYPGVTRVLTPELLGWYGRTLHMYDAHLPYLRVSLKDIAFVRRLVSVAAEYIWREHGFKGKSFPGVIYFEAAPPVGKDSPRLVLLGRPDDAKKSSSRSKDILSQKQVGSYIEDLKAVLQDVIGSKYYSGFHYRYRSNQTGTLVPFKLAEINLAKDLTTDQPIKDLQNQLKTRLRLAKRKMQ